MKSEFEPRDIEVIAQKVVDLIKPLLSNSHKQESEIESIFTVETLAKYLQVDQSWVYKQVSLKTIPYFKNGKYTRFRKREIDRWIDSQMLNPIPPLKILRNRRVTT